LLIVEVCNWKKGDSSSNLYGLFPVAYLVIILDIATVLIVLQTYLVVAEPEDGCGELKETPSVRLESVDGFKRSQDQIQWMILIKDSDQCSWHSKMILAKVKGYVGVIAFAGKSDDENLVELKKTDWNSLEGFYMKISIVNVEDATKLKKYTYPKP